jgi:hypothetical protein
MPALVTEDWTKNVFVPGQSATREFDVTGVADVGEAHDALVAQTGVDYGQRYPILRGDPINVQEGGIAWSRNGRMHHATVSYTRGTIGDIGDYLALKWDCKLDWIVEDLFMGRDGAGRPIVNSNGDKLDTNLTRKRKSCLLRMTRWETGSDVISKNLTFGGRWNSAPITFPKLGNAAIGEALLDTVGVEEGFRASDARVRVTYAFLLRPRIEAWKPNASPAAKELIHGFHAFLPDVGSRGSYAVSNDRKPSPLVWNNDTDVGPCGPVLLNGRGVPIQKGIGVAKRTGTGAAATITIGLPEAAPSSPAYMLTTPANLAPGATGVEAATLLYDYSEGSADFNNLNLAANN